MTNSPESPFTKGGCVCIHTNFKTGARKDMLSIYWGAIVFTIKVIANLLFVVRETTGYVLECFETQHKWFEAHHKWGFILGEGAEGTRPTDCQVTPARGGQDLTEPENGRDQRRGFPASDCIP